MSKRRVKRERDNARALDDAAAEAAIVLDIQDDNLFTLDRGASKAARRRMNKDVELKDNNGNIISTSELRIIEKRRKDIEENGLVIKDSNGKFSNFHDIWGNDEDDDLIKRKSNGKLIKTKNNRSINTKTRRSQQPSSIAKSLMKSSIGGQSYNPSVDDHKKALKEAALLEKTKLEKDKVNIESLVVNTDDIKQITKDNRIKHDISEQNNMNDNENEYESDSDSDSDSDDYLSSSSDDDIDDDIDDDTKSKGKNTMNLSKKERQLRNGDKMTRTERNKQRERKRRVHEENLNRNAKKLGRSLNTAAEVSKKLKKEKAEQEKRRKDILKLKKATAEKQKISLTYHEAGYVPLPDELVGRGSLRLIRPKGSTIVAQQQGMVEVGDATSRTRRNRKHNEKPHAAKRIKWVAKHKYTGK